METLYLYLCLSDCAILRIYYRTRGLKYPLLAKRLACMVISGATSAESLDILQPERLSAEMISQVSLATLYGMFLERIFK